MAIFRKIHVTFWSYSFISELKDRERIFYLYLLTNEKTTQCGVYEITKKQIAFDLGYSTDTVSILLNNFQKLGKILPPANLQLKIGINITTIRHQK